VPICTTHTQGSAGPKDDTHPTCQEEKVKLNGFFELDPYVPLKTTDVQGRCIPPSMDRGVRSEWLRRCEDDLKMLNGQLASFILVALRILEDMCACSEVMLQGYF